MGCGKIKGNVNDSKEWGRSPLLEEVLPALKLKNKLAKDLLYL